MSPFARQYDADQTWHCNPADVAKELGLIENRKNDLYPQGRDNCMQFLRECQMRGIPFKVKTVKTKPYWTWYYEYEKFSDAAPAPVPVPVPTPAYPTPGGGMYRDMSAFSRNYNADQTWHCNPADVAKELGLIESRKNDLYPQGRDNCMQFLRDCQMRGVPFKVKAVKTNPYWTWYFEYENPSAAPAPAPAYPSGGMVRNMSEFTTHHYADQEWNCNPGDVAKEIGLIDNRKNDSYPQGRDNCKQFLRDCQMRGVPFKVKALKTNPYWTWYFEVSNTAGPAPAHGGMVRNMSEFTTHHYADQEWNCNPGDVAKEIGLIDKRTNDSYPQGRDNCKQFLRDCQMRGMRFKVKALKTNPYWTWYFELA